jgi:hypothetical protein
MDNMLHNASTDLKSLLPDLVTGSQAALEQTKNVQAQLQQPVLSKLDETAQIFQQKLKDLIIPQQQRVQTSVVEKAKPNPNTPAKMKYNKKLFMINLVCTLLVIVGALNWGAHVFNVNLVTILSSSLNKLIAMVASKNYEIRFDVVVYALVFSAAVILASQKSTWLPFLGSSVLPSSLVPLKTPLNNNQVVSINTKPNTKVAYWSTLPNTSDKLPFVIDAYGDYSNSGVVMSDDKGVALLPILEGSGYYVPSGKTLKKHVHWRLIHENGMMGPVRTYFY